MPIDRGPAVAIGSKSGVLTGALNGPDWKRHKPIETVTIGYPMTAAAVRLQHKENFAHEKRFNCN
jgi:hypothetical protein